MMKKPKNKEPTTKQLLLIGVFLLFVGILALWWLIGLQFDYEEKIARCPEYEDTVYFGSGSQDYSFVDCYGVVIIEKSPRTHPSERHYAIKDVRDKHYWIASVSSKNAYKIEEEFIYVFDDNIESADPNVELNNVWMYSRHFYVKGEFKAFYYSERSEIPLYLKINTQTGEVTLYNVFEEMPENDREVFEGILQIL